MKQVIIGAVLILALAVLAACGRGGGTDTSQSGGGVQKITAEKAKEMMDAGGVTVVDVRTEDEFISGHISGAVLVPNETIGNDAPAALPDKDAVLLVYCRSGRRSAEASEKLSSLGYKNVYDFGGIIDWPYDVVTGE